MSFFIRLNGLGGGGGGGAVTDVNGSTYINASPSTGSVTVSAIASATISSSNLVARDSTGRSEVSRFFIQPQSDAVAFMVDGLNLVNRSYVNIYDSGVIGNILEIQSNGHTLIGDATDRGFVNIALGLSYSNITVNPTLSIQALALQTSPIISILNSGSSVLINMYQDGSNIFKIHNNQAGYFDSGSPCLASARYAPNFSNPVNLISILAQDVVWSRVGNVVHCATLIRFQSAGAGVCRVEMDLPAITMSPLNGIYGVATGVDSNGAYLTAYVVLAGSNLLSFEYISQGASSDNFNLVFMFEVN